MLVRSFRVAALVVLIGSTFATIARAAESSAPAVPEPTAPSGREKVESALDKKINIEFAEMPLSDAVEFLRQQLKIEIQLDTKALEDAGAGSDTPITRSLHGVTARSVLRLTLGGLDLTYLIEDEMLVITTPEVASNELRTDVYPASDLVADTNALGEPIEDYQPLQNLISNSIRPESWDEVGGPGGIEAVQGKLVINQTDEVHVLIQDLINRIRELKQLPADAPLPPPIPIGRTDTAANAIVRAALERPLNLEFNETPLSDVADFLRSQLKIEVQLDSKSLEDAGAASDTPVTFRSTGVATHAALKRLLRRLDLTYLINDEVLLITTTDKAATDINTTLMPLRDLVSNTGDPIDALDQLCSTIRATVQPVTWDEVGGPGSVMAVPVAQAILVSTTDDVSNEVTALLKKLRQEVPVAGNSDSKNAAAELQTRIYKLHADQPATPAPPPAPAKPGDDKKSPVTIVAGLPSKGAKQPTPAEVAQLLQKTTELEAWKKEGASILVFGDKLIIRQTPVMHRRIKRLLTSLQLLESSNGMSFHDHFPGATVGPEAQGGGGFF